MHLLTDRLNTANIILKYEGKYAEPKIQVSYYMLVTFLGEKFCRKIDLTYD